MNNRGLDNKPVYNPSLSAEGSKPAPRAGSGLRGLIGDKMKNAKYINYKPARIHNEGKWFVYYSYRDPDSMKFVRFKIYKDLNRIPDPKERSAQAEYLATSINELLAEGYNPFNDKPLEVSSKRFTVFQALHFWKSRIEQTSERKKTGQSYGIIKNHLTKSFPKVHEPLDSITKHDYSDFLLRLKKKEELSNRTYNNYLAFSKTFFNFCVEAGYIEKNPIQSLKELPTLAKKNKYFDDETFEKLKRHALPDLRFFLEFLYETGMRPGEARQMQYKHIQDNRLFVPASISKNKRDEYVPLSASFAEKLKGKPDEYIFKGKRSPMVSTKQFGEQFTELKKELGLDKDQNLYSIKHTRAVHLARQGASPYEIMNLFRHVSLEDTQRYLRDLGLEINRNVVEKYKGFE